MPVEKPNIPQNNNRATAGVLPALMGMGKKPRSRRVVYPEGEWKDPAGRTIRGPQTPEIEARQEVLPWFEGVN
jgi:hypothetical protein